MIDSASTASGSVETVVEIEPIAVEPVIEVVTTIVEPDVGALAQRALLWGSARQEAVAAGIVSEPLPESKADPSLLPKVSVSATPEATAPEPAPVEEAQPESSPEPAPPTTTTPAEPAGEDTPPPADPSTEEAAPSTGETENESAATVALPAPPAQVAGRVAPPATGPTAAQWDALRSCESSHNYGAVSPTGLYRGAYQFSQQTWDWVAGVHWPFLVGIDPAQADPGWQDVMAYTLYAMRGWDQWPICGLNLN